MQLSRRGFLKAVAVTTAGLLIPKVADILLVPVRDEILTDIGPFVREMFVRDVLTDTIQCRWDILVGNNLYGVDARLDLQRSDIKAQYQESKKLCVSMLTDVVQHEDITFDQFRKLPNHGVDVGLLEFLEHRMGVQT